MVIERPAPLTGTADERIEAIYEYLCRLSDALNTADLAKEVLDDDCGTGVALRNQFMAIYNLLKGE